MENSGNNYLDQEDEKYIDDRNLSSSLTSDNLEDIPIEIEAKNTDAQDISAKKLQNNPNIEVIESMNAYTHNDSDYDSNDFETQQLRSSVGQNYNQSGVETPKQTPSLNGSDWMKDINQSDELSKNISYQDNDFNASFDQQKRKESMVQKIYAEKSRFSSVSVSKPVSKRCFCFSSASSRKKTKCASKKEEFDNRLFNSNINASMIESEKGAENVSAENSLELSEDLINTKPYVIDSDIEISQKMPEISLAEDGLLPLHRGDGDDFERSESLRDQVESFEESPFLEQTNGEDLEVADEKNDIEQSVSLSLQIDEKACEVEEKSSFFEEVFQISDSEKNENEASIGTKKANSEEFLTIELLDMRSMSRKILQNGFLPSAVLMIGFLSFLYALLILLCFAYYTLIRNFKNSTFLLIICLVVPIIILAFMLLLYTKLNEHKRSRRRRISAISAYDYKYEGEYGQAQGKTNRTIKDEFTSNLSLTKPLSEFVSPEESKLSERETKSAQIEAFGEPVQDSQNISASLSLGVSRNELSDQIDYIEEMGQPEELNEQKDDNLAASTMDDQRASISMSISKQSGFVHKYESERRPTREKTRTQKSSLAYPRVSVSQKPSSSCFCIGKKKTAQATISPSKNSADQLCDIFEFSNADEAKLFRPSIDYNQIAQIDQSFGSDQVFLDSDRSASAPNHSKSPSLSNDSARVQNRMSEGMLGEEFDMEDYEQAATYEEEIAEAAENQYAEEEEEQLERSQAELHML